MSDPTITGPGSGLIGAILMGVICVAGNGTDLYTGTPNPEQPPLAKPSAGVLFYSAGDITCACKLNRANGPTSLSAKGQNFTVETSNLYKLRFMGHPVWIADEGTPALQIFTGEESGCLKKECEGQNCAVPVS